MLVVKVMIIVWCENVLMQASDEETVSQSPNQETPHTSRYDAHDQVVRGKANLIIRSDCIQL